MRRGIHRRGQARQRLRPSGHICAFACRSGHHAGNLHRAQVHFRSLDAARPDAADWTRRLREAALQDEEGKALDGAIQTIRSFA